MATDGRQVLLTRVVAHLRDAGIKDLTIRSLAAAVGSSHRMLLYHFGSLDGIVEAVVLVMEDEQRALFDELAFEDSLSLADATTAMWKQLCAPELHAFERLFFELYARLLQDDDRGLAERLVTSWVEPATALLVSRGMPRPEATQVARLGLAVFRGLLLDLLATGDTPAVDAAMHAYTAAMFPPSP